MRRRWVVVFAEGAAALDSVSCASAGNCAAGGYYQETGPFALQGSVTYDGTHAHRRPGH